MKIFLLLIFLAFSLSFTLNSFAQMTIVDEFIPGVYSNLEYNSIDTSGSSKNISELKPSTEEFRNSDGFHLDLSSLYNEEIIPAH